MDDAMEARYEARQEAAGERAREMASEIIDDEFEEIILERLDATIEVVFKELVGDNGMVPIVLSRAEVQRLAELLSVVEDKSDEEQKVLEKIGRQVSRWL